MSDQPITDLVPCPLCGGTSGYELESGDGYKYLDINCADCGEKVAECRSMGWVFSSPRPKRAPTADTAWNEAGAYAEGLRVKVADLERMGSELSAGHCVHKRGIVAGEHGHALCPLAVDLGFQVPSEPNRISRHGIANVYAERDRLSELCRHVHDRILRGDSDKELLELLEEAWTMKPVALESNSAAIAKATSSDQ